MKKVRLGDLRRIDLPAKSSSESDLIASLRRNVESELPDKVWLYVPDEMAAMIPKLEKPTAPKTTTATNKPLN